MIHYFNPGHEAAVLNASPNYMPPANPLKMQHDLAFLPAWYAPTGDYVLIENPLPDIFIRMVADQFPDLDRAVTRDELNSKKNELNGMEVSFWGISPQAIHLFQQLNREYDLNLLIPQWKEEYKLLTSRRSSMECLKSIIQSVNGISDEMLPRFYSGMDEIEQVIREKPTSLLIKSPYSSSGRGLLWVDPDGLTLTKRQILQGLLRKQKEVSIEKALRKQLDFAMLFYLDGNGTVGFKAYSLFQTDNKGNYEGNSIFAQELIESKLHAFVSYELLEEVKSHLISFLTGKYASVYKGCIGVDMMIYLDDGGKYRLYPCVEINMRYSMGWLAFSLYRNFFAGNVRGYLRIDYCAEEGSAYRKHQEMQEQYPATITGGRLQSGYLPLCPVTGDNKYWAYVLAGDISIQ